MHIKNTISCWEMMKEVEMTIGLMMLRLDYVPSLLAEKSCSESQIIKLFRSVSDKGSMNSKKSKDSHESGISRTSRETRPSKSSRDREIKEKMKVAELIADAELLQQKLMIQNEKEKLKIEERLAKAKDRIQTYNNIELESGNEKEQLSLLYGSLQRISEK